MEAERRAAGRVALPGLPTGAQLVGGQHFIPGPYARAHEVAENYMRSRDLGTPYAAPDRYHPIDPEHSKAIAQAFEEMKHAPDDPAVKASYDALVKETLAQYQAIKNSGLKLTPTDASTYPYHGNPREVAKDVADNNHMAFFKTDHGFGSDPNSGIDLATHPMMQPSGETLNGVPLLNNDLFRIVHDYFGHIKNGYGFRAAGEDNAWRAHAAMYSDLARPAMTTETRGQNSWVNYGPHGEKNRTASGADTVYADQKVGLMPDWTMYDRGKEPLYSYTGSPHKYAKPDISKVGIGEGNQAYGHGLYSAEHEPVAERYRIALSTMQDPLLKKYRLQEVGHILGGHLAEAGGDVAALAQKYRTEQQRLVEAGTGTKADANMIKEYDRRIKYLTDPNRARGHMYKQALEAPVERLLDYDVPFKEQSGYVQERVGPHMEESVQKQIEAINQLLGKGGYGDPASPRFRRLLPGVRAGLEGRLLALEQTGHSSFPGKEIYKRMGLPAVSEAEGAVKASTRLRELGIPALRYLDAGSRVATGHAPAKGTHNYVTFDDSLLRILRRYGIAGLPFAGAAAIGQPEEERERFRGGRIHKAGGGAFGVFSPGEQAELDEVYPLQLEPEPDDSPVRYRTASPLVNITERDIGRAIETGLGAATIGGEGRVARKVVDDTGAAMRAARRAKRYAEPEYSETGNLITNKGVDNPPNPKIQTVADPYRMMYPGIYRDPRIIAAEAAERVGPEDPAMKRLFGVTRGDLRDMAQGRVGNEEPRLHLFNGPRGALAAQNIQTPQNSQRLIDILEEGGKHEGLRTADAWYIMDPVFRRMAELFGPEEAVKRYRHFNTLTGMASPSSNVTTEINRGTAAHWLDRQGRFDDFAKYAGIPEDMRARVKFPADMRAVPGHPYHRTSQAGPMANYLEHGEIQSKKPKVPLYVHASGVPETGFQTTGPVGDAHFSRGVGLADTRKGPSNVQGSFSTREYETLQPWWQHDVAAPAGLESVPAQARLWTVLGPQTGVDSALGAPKLELLSQQIMEAARRLRISPERARDMVLSGETGAFLTGGRVTDPAMDIARSIKRASGGKVHLGPIVGDTGGRADKVAMRVPNGAYVFTADHVSGLGEGNTEAGMKKLSAMFPKSKPSTLRQLPADEAIPIYAADGEFVVAPEDIVDRFGQLDYGHKALDAWQTQERQHLIETLKGLDPPAQD